VVFDPLLGHPKYLMPLVVIPPHVGIAIAIAIDPEPDCDTDSDPDPEPACPHRRRNRFAAARDQGGWVVPGPVALLGGEAQPAGLLSCRFTIKCYSSSWEAV